MDPLRPRLQTGSLLMFREGHLVLQVSAVQDGTSVSEVRRAGRSITPEAMALPFVASVEPQIGRAEQGEDSWDSDRSEIHVGLKAGADVDQLAARRTLRCSRR